MANDVISTGCVHLSTTVLLLELLYLGVWDVQQLSNIVHVLLNGIQDNSEIIDCQCGLCMTGKCMCVWRRWDVCTDVVSVSIRLSVINKINVLLHLHSNTYTCHTQTYLELSECIHLQL